MVRTSIIVHLTNASSDHFSLRHDNYIIISYTDMNHHEVPGYNTQIQEGGGF